MLPVGPHRDDTQRPARPIPLSSVHLRCYLDESGDCGLLRRAASVHFTVGGLAVPEPNEARLTKSIPELLEEFFPGAREASKRPARWEMKGTKLRSRLRSPRPGATRRTRRYFTRLCELLSEEQAQLVGCAFIKATGRGAPGPPATRRRVLRAVLSRLDQLAQLESSTYDLHHDHLADQAGDDELERIAQGWNSDLNSAGFRGFELCSSARSPLLQAADHLVSVGLAVAVEAPGRFPLNGEPCGRAIDAEIVDEMCAAMEPLVWRGVSRASLEVLYSSSGRSHPWPTLKT